MNNYLIAVGGSGQHLALALVDYLALAWHASAGGYPESDAWEILLLDADQEAAEGSKSAWALAKAQGMRLQAAGLQVHLKELAPVEKPDGLFAQPTPEIVAGRGLTPEVASALLPLLFTTRQLGLNMNQGYWGEPRVAAFFGARWLKASLNDPVNALKNVQGVLQASPADTRVAIAGSIAGGTGAGLVEPLRQWLTKIAVQAGVPQNVMISVGMEWFRVSGEAKSVLSSRMRHNASSCLLPFLANPGQHRFNIWAHPAVDTIMEESDGKDMAQPAKRNLTIPWFAATNLASFFSAKPPSTVRFSNAAAGDSVAVIRTEIDDVPQLVASNREMVGRLRLAGDYLTSPWDGWAEPWLASRGRVSVLDGIEQKQQLFDRIRNAADAKELALQRLGMSEERNSKSLSINVPRQHSIDRLREMSRTGQLSDYGHRSEVSPAGVATTLRLLPQYTLKRLADAANPAPGAAAGSRAPLTAAMEQALADPNAIAITRIPRLDALQMLMEEFLKNPAEWPGTLIKADGHAVEVRPLVGPTDDHTTEWMRRWFLVLRALLNGRVTRRSYQASASIATELRTAGVTVSDTFVAQDVLVFDSGEGEHAIGFLYDQYVALPATGGIWSKSAELEILEQAASGLAMTTSWCAALRRNFAPAPAWLEYLNAQLPLGQVNKNLRASNEKIRILFGAAREEVPLPSAEGQPFDVAVGKPISSSKKADYAARLKELELAGADAPRYLLRELEENFEEFAAGAIGGAIQIAKDAILTEDSIFTAEILQLANNTFALPIKSGMVNHVQSWRIDQHGSDVLVELVLRGRSEAYAPKIRREYVASKGSKKPLIRPESEFQSSVLLSPGLRPASAEHTQASSVFLGGVKRAAQKREVQVLWSDEWGGFAGAGTEGKVPVLQATSGWLDAGGRMSRVGAAAPMTSCRAVAFRGDFDGSMVEVGIVPLPAKTLSMTSDVERWAVDYGTSSTVVAYAEEEGAEILRLDGTYDTTVPVLNAFPVASKDLTWQPTWDGKGPRTSRLPGAMGSHLLVIKADGETKELGKHYVNDFAWEIDLKNIQDYQIRYTKWGNDPLRSAFNRNVLELALISRLAKKKALPAKIEVVFTVPYRQRAEIRTFEQAVNAALQEVKGNYGVEVHPRFLWESHALRPALEKMKSGVFIGADLGGGTLDLYAAHYVNDEGVPMISKPVIDSARIGADVLVYGWAREDVFPELNLGDMNPLNKTAIIKSHIRGGELSASWSRVNGATRTKDYWNSLLAYIDHWARAVLAYWELPSDSEVQFDRFGLGWLLFDIDPYGGFSWLQRLNDTSQANHGPRYVEVKADRGDRTGKEELAYRAARMPRDETFGSIDNLIAAEAKILLGLDCHSANSSSAAGSLLSDFIPKPKGVGFQNMAAVTNSLGVSQVKLEEAVTQMNNFFPHGALLDIGGATGKRLVVSPLTLAVEQLVLEKVGPLPQVAPV